MNTMDNKSLLQEIDDDLARQRLENLWKKHGDLIIAFILALVLGTAGTTWWKSHTLAEQHKTTSAYLALYDQKLEGKTAKDDLAKAFAAYAQENNGKPLAAFALFQQAGLAVQDGRKDEALALYNQIAADSKVEPVFRQLADLLFVMTDMDTGDAKALEAKLEPLMKEGAWRFIAKEMAAHLAIKAGDKEKAKALFNEMKAMPDLPKNVELRTNDMLSWLSKGE